MWLLSAEHGTRPRAQANSSSLLIGCGFRDRSDRSAATADLDRQRKEAGRQLDGRTPGRPTGSPSGTHDDPGSTVGGTPFEPQREDGRGSAIRSGVPGRHAPAAPRSAQRRAVRSSRSNRPRCPRSIGQAEVAAAGSGTGPAQPAAATARRRTSAPGHWCGWRPPGAPRHDSGDRRRRVSWSSWAGCWSAPSPRAATTGTEAYPVVSNAVDRPSTWVVDRLPTSGLYDVAPDQRPCSSVRLLAGA